MATIFRADNCAYTKVPSLIRTAKAYAALDNGVPVTLSGLVSGEREKFTSVAVTATTAVADLWIVTTPELEYDETPHKFVGDFTNAENATIRVCKLQKGDIFSITADKITNTPDLTTNLYLAPAAAGWTAGATGSYDFAKLLKVESFAGKTLYVYEVL